MLELLNQIVSRSAGGDSLAVCTVVRARGSTPQKAGAMMIVLLDGTTLGTIGGGCVEAEVRTRALRLISEPSDRVIRFKLDHDLGWDDGLICGGTMEVAVQVIRSPDQADAYRQTRDQLSAGNSALLNIQALDEQNRIAAFALPVQPEPTLVIAGAGHVGAALAAVAAAMDFRVIVIDDRADLASADRFPGAALRVGSVEVELAKLRVNEHSYVVIVTRGHRGDEAALAAVVGSNARYIGLIGSRRKVLTIFADLREQGVSDDALSRVHAPIGLDIGAVSPAEIAVSIAAEIIAVRRGSSENALASMRLKREDILRK